LTTSTDRFAPRSNQDVLRLVLEQPLASIVSGGVENLRSTLLPVRPVTDADGRITALEGHFARSNDHFELLRKQPRALIQVLGPHGYISPSWVQDKTWAPTWNYATVQFLVDMVFFEDAAAIETHLRDLVDTMEAQRPNAWSVDQMGPRYHSLATRVIGFRARVLETRAKFKLGQDERDAVFHDITLGLAQYGDAKLLQWMQDFNSWRPNQG